jgi:hypothetical protein
MTFRQTQTKGPFSAAPCRSGDCHKYFEGRERVDLCLPETSFIGARELGATIVTPKMAWLDQGHLKATAITF